MQFCSPVAFALHRRALEPGKQNLEPDEPMIPDFVAKLAGMTE